MVDAEHLRILLFHKNKKPIAVSPKVMIYILAAAGCNGNQTAVKIRFCNTPDSYPDGFRKGVFGRFRARVGQFWRRNPIHRNRCC
jgi:hypothetical protein